jgi:hypothetical protein
VDRRSGLSVNGNLRATRDVLLEATTDENRVDLMAGGYDAGIHYAEFIEKDMSPVRVSPDHQPAIVGSCRTVAWQNADAFTARRHPVDTQRMTTASTPWTPSTQTTSAFVITSADSSRLGTGVASVALFADRQNATQRAHVGRAAEHQWPQRRRRSRRRSQRDRRLTPSSHRS